MGTGSKTFRGDDDRRFVVERDSEARVQAFAARSVLRLVAAGVVQLSQRPLANKLRILRRVRSNHDGAPEAEADQSFTVGAVYDDVSADRFFADLSRRTSHD